MWGGRIAVDLVPAIIADTTVENGRSGGFESGEWDVTGRVEEGQV